jgi:hypothetical protein
MMMMMMMMMQMPHPICPRKTLEHPLPPSIARQPAQPTALVANSLIAVHLLVCI